MTMKTHNGDPTNPITTPPIITYKALILLYVIFTTALTDLVLSLTNLGLTSFFLGLTAASATIIHILTQLIIIFFRVRSQSHECQLQRDYDLPPTSEMFSIMMDVLLATIFIGAVVVTVIVRVLDYFGDGSGSGTTVLGAPVGIVYADAAVEGVCAIMLIVLAVIGSMERRWFLELSRIPSSRGST